MKKKHPDELRDVLDAIGHLSAVSCLTKASKEKTKKGKLLFSPRDSNDQLKLELHKKGWTQKAVAGKKKPYIEPRIAFGGNRFREMDGIKNRVGLEIQFGKYAFMGYDIFSKMIIFKNRDYIECGIEVIPGHELVQQMSTGVSSLEQFLIDLNNRGVSNIDIPVYVIGIGFTDEERTEITRIQGLYRTDKKKALQIIQLRGNHGARPGPK
ncbi:MAG: BglII/BstYI family type II restriction endonuclease [Patescibacteria group bacterium]